MSAREFHFSEGTSNKFWRIEVDGSSHTVVYGRIGSAGQTQTKEFSSDAEARKSADKLIAEKVKKGYIEQDVDPATLAAAPAPTPRVAPSPKKPETPAAQPAPEPIVGSTPTTVVDSAPITPAPAIAASRERALNLPPEDWHVATWRPRVPLPLPEVKPFDLADVGSRLSRITTREYGWKWDWDKAAIQPAMTREEAHCWLWLTTNPIHRDVSPKEMAKRLVAQHEKKPFNGVVRLPDFLKRAVFTNHHVPGYWVRPASILFGTAEVVSAMIELERDVRENLQRSARWYSNELSQAAALDFRRLVVPYLDDAEFQKIRSLLKPLVSLDKWQDAPPIEFRLAIGFGLHEELLRVVESWPDDAFAEDWSDRGGHPQEIIFGLGSPELVDFHMRRLRLRLYEPAYIRYWLAHTEFSKLDYPAEVIRTETNRETAAEFLQQLGLALGPETAPHMLQLILESKAGREARAWMEANPEHTVAGLIPVAAGRGKLAAAATEYLVTLSRKGRQALIDAALDATTPEVADQLRAALAEAHGSVRDPITDAETPDWLRDGLAALVAADRTFAGDKKAPKWIGPEDLPPLPVGEGRMNDAQVRTLLAALAAQPSDPVSAFLQAVRSNVDRKSLDQWVWKLFETWLSFGALPKEKWAMLAVGHFGSDASALRLAPMVRAWPGESQHQRAVLGLDCLRMIGTDTALMQIHGIAQKVPFKGLKQKAAECMEAIATERGMTRPELEDRIVPTCELDERGNREFDFGPRKFRFALGPGLKPMVRDDEGKVRPDLPKPTQKDDPAISAAAVDAWKLLKKQVAEVVKLQAIRLEQSMVTQRRWTRDEFELLLVRHPLMTHLVRLLVWTATPEGDGSPATFRVTEDQTLADPSDESFSLDGFSHVEVAHPLRMSDEERSAWGELLSDYEIVPPFPQLGRPTYALNADEAEATEIKRWEKLRIPAASVVFGLEKLDWQRGIPEDGGWFYSHSKPFYGADLTAVVHYDPGAGVGYIQESDPQKLETCFFIPGIWRPEMYPDHKKRIPLKKVPDVVISEVLADLELLASKAT